MLPNPFLRSSLFGVNKVTEIVVRERDTNKFCKVLGLIFKKTKKCRQDSVKTFVDICKVKIEGERNFLYEGIYRDYRTPKMKESVEVCQSAT